MSHLPEQHSEDPQQQFVQAPELSWRHPLYRTKYLWRTSLQFRAVAGAGMLLAIAFSFVGSFLSHQIANSLFNGRLDQALEDSSSGFSNVQTLLNSSDATGRTEIQSDVMRFMTVLEASGGDSQRQWLLAPNNNSASEGFISSQSQYSTVSAADIPADLLDAVSSGNGIFWQSSSLTIDGVNSPVLFVGTSISIPQNPNYGLYLVYDLSSSQSTLNYINLVVGVTFIILLIVVLSIVWVITRSVIRPISSTAITAEKLASGDLGQRVIVRGHNETARLGSSFNEMADSLQDQISRLETLSTMQQRFVSDVSHELRTPLTTVRMAAELLYDGRQQLQPTHRRSSELLYNQVERFESLLADLLEISRYDAGSAKLDAAPIDLMAVIYDVLISVQPHLDRTATELRVRAQQPQLWVEMDQRRIERVLRNLLYNAVEYGEGKPIDLYVAAHETAVAVAVRDHGVGLSQEQVEQVFNRFWRADPSRKRTLGGTGLGLSIAAEDVRLHSGSLEAWGEPGQGSCFRLTLPLRQDEPMGSSPLRLSGQPMDPQAASWKGRGQDQKQGEDSQEGGMHAR
ncbi:MAG: MtrAB system histidine kinase MtrB [Rothia sp. (in: high G+C Gram-positive bacteria)]|nr:MtrAB system histidine kinase MtrB [Rothia sp. (in: high G+C Gram-positive bacteria)]